MVRYYKSLYTIQSSAEAARDYFERVSCQSYKNIWTLKSQRRRQIQLRGKSVTKRITKNELSMSIVIYFAVTFVINQNLCLIYCNVSNPKAVRRDLGTDKKN